MTIHDASHAHRLAWCLALVATIVSSAGCHVATEVRLAGLAAPANRPFVAEDGARLEIRNYGRVNIDGPVQFHRSGDALVIIESTRWSSVRLEDVERAYVRAHSPERTALLLALIPVGVIGMVVAMFAMFAAIGDALPDFSSLGSGSDYEPVWI